MVLVGAQHVASRFLVSRRPQTYAISVGVRDFVESAAGCASVTCCVIAGFGMCPT